MPTFLATLLCSEIAVNVCSLKLSLMHVVTEYRVDPTDLHLSGLEAFTFDYVVKWPVSLVISRKVCLSV